MAMFTLEEKVNIALGYIACDDLKDLEYYRKKAIEALKSETVFDVDDVIAGLLKDCGLPTHLSGYRYMEYALRLTFENPKYLDSLTTRLYPRVADEFDTYGGNVDRNIRTAINRMFLEGDYEVLDKLFGNMISVNSGKITAGEFITACTFEIRRRMKRLGLSEKGENK